MGPCWKNGIPRDCRRYIIRKAWSREPEFRKQLAEALYQRTCRDFSLEATVRTQQEIYRDILSREREKRK